MTIPPIAHAVTGKPETTGGERSGSSDPVPESRGPLHTWPSFIPADAPSTAAQRPFPPDAGFVAVVEGGTTDEWLGAYADGDGDGEKELEAQEREYKRGAFKWLNLMRQTILSDRDEKHVLRSLADHAWAGPELGRPRAE